MTEVLEELEPKYIEFICSECGITDAELLEMDDDALYDKVYDVMCDIECAETPSNNEPLTKRGEMAEYLVTVLGNTLVGDDEETESMPDPDGIDGLQNFEKGEGNDS